MRGLPHDDIKHRVLSAARALNIEIERYRTSIHKEIEFKKRLLEVENDESLQKSDIHDIKTLRNRIPEQLSIQLKRWLKTAASVR